MEPRRWAGPRDINIVRPVIRPADIWPGYFGRDALPACPKNVVVRGEFDFYNTALTFVELLSAINFALDKYPHNCWVDLSRLLIKYQRL